MGGTASSAEFAAASAPQLSGHIVSNPMKLFREEQRILGCCSVLLLLGGCGGAEPECDSSDSRKSVVKIVSDDNNNALVNLRRQKFEFGCGNAA
jgi:hypothetical protein